MHFGIFHTAKNIYPEVFEELNNSDYISFFLSESTPEDPVSIAMAKEISEKGKKLYVAFFTWIFHHVKYQKMIDVGSDDDFIVKCELYPNWKEIIDKKISFYKSLNIDDTIEGFYIDEPLLNGITLDDFEMVTKYLSEAWPEKRIFCCFSIAGVAPDVWTTGNVEPITPKAGQYLTDVAFDMYHKFDEKYEYISKEMKRRLGNRKDIRIWYVPCVMNYRGDKDEQHCLDHLNGLYDLFKKEDNPGGLICYTYYTFPQEVEGLGNIGLDHLRGQSKGDKNWTRLYNRIIEIGQEITKITNK